MKNVIVNLLGNYVATTYINAEGVEVIPNGVAGLDIPYVIAGIVLCIGLYCTYRVLGEFVKE